MSAASPARIDEARCVGCSQCRLSCSANAVRQATAHYEIDPTRCTGCGKCVWYCPVGCISQGLPTTSLTPLSASERGRG